MKMASNNSSNNLVVPEARTAMENMKYEIANQLGVDFKVDEWADLCIVQPGDSCPKCGRQEEEVHFERIRRITGYLVGTLERFNNGKRAEEHDRVKHGI